MNTHIIKQFVTFLVLLLAIDGVYLYAIAGLFARQIIAVQNAPMKIRWLGAVLCYLLLATCLVVFVEGKNLSLRDTALLGIVIYGVYETTSYALLKGWKLSTVIIDTLWGGLLFTLVTFVYRKWIR